MEPAKIDWKKIDSRFVEDVFYEHIKAPKWFDFLDPHDDVDDDAWFCRPDCDHPKRAEDFLTTPPATSKLPSSGNSGNILRAIDPNQSSGKSRSKALTGQPSTSNNNDSENQNPNSTTPRPNEQMKSWRAAFRSKSGKKTNMCDKLQKEEAPRLNSTLSARNLFQGRDILGHISEFCYELKRLATRVTERDEPVVKPNTQVGETSEPSRGAELEAKKERRPLLQVDKEKLEEVTDRGSSAKEKRRRKKRVDDAENSVPVALNLENVKPTKGEELRLLQIRTNPPSPQCFSATKAASSKPMRSKPMEKGILQERIERAEEEEEEEEKSGNSTIRPSPGLDVLWFLKPCTMAA